MKIIDNDRMFNNEFEDDDKELLFDFLHALIREKNGHALVSLDTRGNVCVKEK